MGLLKLVLARAWRTWLEKLIAPPCQCSRVFTLNFDSLNCRLVRLHQSAKKRGYGGYMHVRSQR